MPKFVLIIQTTVVLVPKGMVKNALTLSGSRRGRQAPLLALFKNGESNYSVLPLIVKSVATTQLLFGYSVLGYLYYIITTISIIRPTNPMNNSLPNCGLTSRKLSPH